jgi:adenylate cyclase, class 2
LPHLNVEIKARCARPDWIRETLLAHHARFVGEDHQVDTYFQVATGRLKLREGNIENALIFYQRDDQTGPKKSEVTMYECAPDLKLKAVLTAAIGVKTVVDKRRSIFFIDNVKFHVDEVQGLGSFVEIEAIDVNNDKTEAELLKQCHFYMNLLDIQSDDLLENSYSDMILN